MGQTCLPGAQVGQCEVGTLPKAGAGTAYNLPSAASLLCLNFFCQLLLPLPLPLCSLGQERHQLLGRQRLSRLSLACRASMIPLGTNRQLQQPTSTSKSPHPEQKPGQGRVFLLQWRSRAQAIIPCMLRQGWLGRVCGHCSLHCRVSRTPLPSGELVLPGRARGRMAVPEQHPKVVFGS